MQMKKSNIIFHLAVLTEMSINLIKYRSGESDFHRKGGDIGLQISLVLSKLFYKTVSAMWGR